MSPHCITIQRKPRMVVSTRSLCAGGDCACVKRGGGKIIRQRVCVSCQTAHVMNQSGEVRVALLLLLSLPSFFLLYGYFLLHISSPSFTPLSVFVSPFFDPSGASRGARDVGCVCDLPQHSSSLFQVSLSVIFNVKLGYLPIERHIFSRFAP